MIKFIKRTLLFILIVALIAGGFIVYQGHQVYKNALNSISLADKIEKIKKDDSYVELSSLPSDYKNAVISVEDHRYYKHGPIDVIAIIRATVSNIRSKGFMEGGSTITQQVAKNLYFIGEVLDLDAVTGGYNLQIAWSTAYLAATDVCRNKQEDTQ